MNSGSVHKDAKIQQKAQVKCTATENYPLIENTLYRASLFEGDFRLETKHPPTALNIDY
jgi:hypothetical protein